MTSRQKVVAGALAGAGLAWGARQLLRLSRRITLEDRVVIITGASTGHGLMVARYAAERGAKLVLAARDTENLYAAEIDMLHAGARASWPCPPTSPTPSNASTWSTWPSRRHGRVDILVNNAGIMLVGPMETMTLEDFEHAMATNFWGTVHCTLAALPHMREQRFGRIANVISLGGKIPVPHLTAYTASKFALAGLTQSLRTELAKDGILVTGVYPNLMRTGGHVHAWIKGDQPAEYSLVGLSDTLPILATSAEHVARKLWQAVCDGDAEVVVGWPARLGGDGLCPLPQLDHRGPHPPQPALAHRIRARRVRPGAGHPRPDPRIPQPADPRLRTAGARVKIPGSRA